MTGTTDTAAVGGLVPAAAYLAGDLKFLFFFQKELAGVEPRTLCLQTTTLTTEPLRAERDARKGVFI